MTHNLSGFADLIHTVDENKSSQRLTTTSIRIKLTLADSTVLYARENYVTHSGWIDYAYQWQTASHQLIVRWDNAHDVPDISTSPHHQHIGSEENIQPSEPMTLEKVLIFISEHLTSN